MRDFVEPELGLEWPVSELAAAILGRICVAVMRDIGAIPVYRKSRKLRLTIEESVERLAAGGWILVFPEVQNALWDKRVNDFHPGFVNIARSLHRCTGMAARFHPICVHRGRNLVLVGEGAVFAPEAALRRREEADRGLPRGEHQADVPRGGDRLPGRGPLPLGTRAVNESGGIHHRGQRTQRKTRR